MITHCLSISQSYFRIQVQHITGATVVSSRTELCLFVGPPPESFRGGEGARSSRRSHVQYGTVSTGRRRFCSAWITGTFIPLPSPESPGATDDARNDQRPTISDPRPASLRLMISVPQRHPPMALEMRQGPSPERSFQEAPGETT
jgi:hypothetical protein